MSSSILSPAAVEYPSSDGRPMAENDAQCIAIMYAIGSLGIHFAHRPDVCVAGDLIIYYVEVEHPARRRRNGRIGVRIEMVHSARQPAARNSGGSAEVQGSLGNMAFRPLTQA